MNFKRTLLAACSLLAALHAVAGPTATWTTNDSHTYANTNGFESTGTLADNTVLTNQFAAQGIVFSGTARANGCGPTPNTGWSQFGMAGQNYVNTFGPSCSTNNVQDTLSMKFNSDLSRLAFDAYSYQSGYADSLVQLFDDGFLVASYTLGSVGFNDLALNAQKTAGSRYYYNTDNTRYGTLVFDANGSKFDELRFVESATGAGNGDYVFLDNVRFDTANSVPEPTALALTAVALAACARVRRRKAA